MFRIHLSSLAIISALLLTILVARPLAAQEEKETKGGKVKVKLKRDLTDSELRMLQGKMQVPAKAALYSVIFPGGGQIYNKKYWKIPILYTGLAFFGFLSSQYHADYTEAVNNLAYATDNTDQYEIENHPLIDDRFANYSAENFIDRRDRFRRERDYYVILSIMWYALGIADAAVDAHLREFNVSDDLSLQIKPDLSPVYALGQPQSLAPGLKFTFTLK